MKYFFETDGGQYGWIEAKSIDEAREIFRAEHPDIRPDRAGVWGPGDEDYPAPRKGQL